MCDAGHGWELYDFAIEHEDEFAEETTKNTSFLTWMGVENGYVLLTGDLQNLQMNSRQCQDQYACDFFSHHH